MSTSLDPIYCRKCKKQIQADAQFCPQCGTAQVQVPTLPGPPPVRAEAPIPEVSPSPKWSQQKLVYRSSLAFIGIVIISGLYSSCQEKAKDRKEKADWQKAVEDHNKKAFSTTPSPTKPPATPEPPPLARMPVPTPPPRQVDQELLARINAVGNIVAENGGTMTVQMSTVRVTIPGGRIDEYSAQRLAKTLGDRIGSGMTIRVYDDVGIERAKYFAW